MTQVPDQSFFDIPPRPTAPHRVAGTVLRRVLWLVLVCIYCVLGLVAVGAVIVAVHVVWWAVSVILQALGV